jgi:DNA-binding response OmpR family regulator
MPDDRRRVLIADDEPAVCALIERVLGPRGYSVLEVSNGYDALRITLTTRLDLIVLDVFMPGYSGLDILYRVRAEGIETPVIVISGRPDDQMVDDAKTLGAIWMAKPFDGEAMVKMVEATIGEACETPSDTATSS